mgnify:CR=1 FL=1
MHHIMALVMYLSLVYYRYAILSGYAKQSSISYSSWQWILRGINLRKSLSKGFLSLIPKPDECSFRNCRDFKVNNKRFLIESVSLIRQRPFAHALSSMCIEDLLDLSSAKQLMHYVLRVNARRLYSLLSYENNQRVILAISTPPPPRRAFYLYIPLVCRMMCNHPSCVSTQFQTDIRSVFETDQTKLPRALWIGCHYTSEHGHQEDEWNGRSA